MHATPNEEQLLGQYIPLHYHYQMLLDRARMSGFRQAITYAVPDGGKVVELGAGTGVLSFFAAQRASKVWCVERNPQMVEVARGFLAQNGCGPKVEVVEGDATTYLPPEPVDVVVCEMLHSALLREKQIQVIEAFKQNYQKAFGAKLPRFVPEATILGVQPVEQNFKFEGYVAPVPMFFEPTVRGEGTNDLGDPAVYSMFEYGKVLPHHFPAAVELKISTAGTFNALRFVTKNILAIVIESNSTIDWHNFYLVLPIQNPVTVAAGDRLSVSFSYQAGGSIESLSQSLIVRKL